MKYLLRNSDSSNGLALAVMKLLLCLLLVTSFLQQVYSEANAASTSDKTIEGTGSPITPDSGNGATAASIKPAFWREPDEQTWIVDSTCKDIAEMLTYAKYKTEDPDRLRRERLTCRTIPVDKDKGHYRFECPGKDAANPIVFDFTFANYAWSPDDYAPLAKQLVLAFDLKPAPPSTAPPGFLKAVSDATMDSLFQQNERISKALSASPLDPALHEQAALLQAVLDLLECAREYSDTRPPLSRIAAHLAVAEALAPDSQPNIIHQIADIALESMSCRDGVAVKKITEIENSQSDPIAQSLLRAIKIRSTGDYRLIREDTATPLESTQYGLRLAFHVSSDAILDYMRRHRPQPEICWRRIGLMGRWTVAAGHAFADDLMSAEVDEFYQDYHRYKKQIFSDMNQLGVLLNEIPTRCLSLEDGSPHLVAVSWDDVAAYHARHILSATGAEYKFYRYIWGVPDRAKAFISQATTWLSALKLFPVVLSGVDLDEKQKEVFLSSAQSVLRQNPELLTYSAWDRLTDKLKELNPSLKPPAPEEWFSPLVPIGTAYYFLVRYDAERDPAIDLQQLTHLKDLCPYDQGLCEAWTKKKYGSDPTAKQLQEGYGPLLDFDVLLIAKVAYADYKSLDNFISWMEKGVKIEPSLYLEIGDACVNRNQPDRAAKYYEKAVALCKDQVRLSNDSDWLINYWYDHGQKQKAMGLALHAGRVYSERGLVALAHLYERMGKLDYAAETYRNIKERYGTDSDANGFYLRHPVLTGRSAQAAIEYRRKTFPNGMKPVILTALKGPPITGAKMGELSWAAEAAGLRSGQIIVGLNGYAVQNRAQYMLIKDMQPPGNFRFRFTVWDGKAYQELVRTKLFTFNLDDYKPAATK